MAAKESTHRRGSLGFEHEQDEMLGREEKERDVEPEPSASPARIVLDEHGVPVIAGANTKVVEVVGHWQASEETAAELAADLPHLSVEQVEAALEYYRTHPEEIDEDMERRATYVERLRQELGEPPYVERLRKPS